MWKCEGVENAEIVASPVSPISPWSHAKRVRMEMWKCKAWMYSIADVVDI